MKELDLFFVCEYCGYSQPVQDMTIVKKNILSCLHCNCKYKYDTVIEDSELRDVEL